MILVFFAQSDHPGSPKGAAQLVYRLRGGPVFDTMKKFGMRLTLANEDGSIDVPKRPPMDCVAYADLSLLVDMPQIVDYIDQNSMKLVIDVHFPFGMKAHIRAVQPGRDDETRDPSIDQRAAELWTTAEQIETARRILAKADVLTVPRAEWIGSLRQYARRAQPIMVLPDVTDPKAGGIFYKILNKACARALRIKSPNWHRPFMLLSQALVAFDIQHALAATETDWEALKRGEATPTG